MQGLETGLTNKDENGRVAIYLLEWNRNYGCTWVTLVAFTNSFGFFVFIRNAIALLPGASACYS